MTTTTIIKSPADCNESELDTFERLAKDGGQVLALGLRSRIENAEKLIFILKNGVCVAIAGLKNPLRTYQEKVFHAAGMLEKSGDYQFEIGYIYANIKGVGNQLMEGIIQASEGSPTFATTQDANAQMQYLLPKFGFSRLGESYLNDKKEYKLGLFGSHV